MKHNYKFAAYKIEPFTVEMVNSIIVSYNDITIVNAQLDAQTHQLFIFYDNNSNIKNNSQTLD